MENQMEAPAARPAPKRKVKAKPKRKVAAKPPGADAVFAGLTSKACAAGCGERGCVISHDICVHPHKGGLQPAHRTQPQTVARYEAAKQYLAHQAVDKRLR